MMFFDKRRNHTFCLRTIVVTEQNVVAKTEWVFFQAKSPNDIKHYCLRQ